MASHYFHSRAETERDVDMTLAGSFPASDPPSWTLGVVERSGSAIAGGPVLIATDLSPQSDEALRQGVRLAADLSATLYVCHVVPELLPDGSVFGEFRRANLQVADSVLATARAAVEQQVKANADAVLAEIILDSGTPHAGVLRQAEKTAARVVVLAPGSVALEVARHTGAAVLIARPSPRGAVVAATDFSAASVAAVQAAADEADRRASPLHLLHAFDVGMFALGHASAAAMPYLLGSSPIALEGLENLHDVAKQRLGETMATLGIDGKTAVVSGAADAAIVGYAESIRAELVVVGTRGRSGLARLALGSTAAAVAESAPCSVLIVRRM